MITDSGFWELSDLVELDNNEAVELENSDLDSSTTPTPIHSHTAIPTPLDERFTVYDSDPLPSWITGFREHQWDAALEAVEAFKSGVDVVWIDAPTGTGKTLVGELVRRLMEVDSFYTSPNKALQDQFNRDFPYAPMLKGRSNYATIAMPFPDYTAADCTKTGNGEGDMCLWCPVIYECAYEKAKESALSAKVSVLNTSYLLTEGNYIGKTRGRGLVIIDECDTLESELMNFVQYQVSEYRLKKLRLDAPKKGVRKKTILDWMIEELQPHIENYIRSIPVDSDINHIRDRNSYKSLLDDTKRIVIDLTQELEAGLTEEDSASNWVRDNDAGPMVLKPVRVGHYGKMLWGLGQKWLCMSATIVSSDEMNESLGVNELGLRTHTVTVPMMFPKENRPIVAVPITAMTYSNREQSWPKMAAAVKRVMELHPDERVLVHTVSYAFSKFLMEWLRDSRCITYTSSGEKEAALRRYRHTPGAVLLASSMDRGVDLKDDDCRVVVIAKVPFPNLGDRQVGMRMRGRGGQEWYNVQTVRKLIQMTGRGVRSNDDWCVTYIFDEMFLSKIWKQSKELLPQWWKDAVEVRRVKEFQ